MSTGLLATVLAVTLLGLAGTAHAEEPKGFGELTRFAEKGDGPGQLDELRTHAIGVDPTDNSVYAVDEPTAPVVAAGKIERHFRLQKFKAPAGEYSVSASATFTESSTYFEGVTNEPTIEGIAVDPAAKKVYLLALDIRENTLKQDNSESGKDLLAASTLYAFSTQESGANLLPAGKEGTANEILTGPGALGTQSETPGAALLAPRGITVDPKSGEVIILGHIDPVKRAMDESNLSGDHFAVQRVKSDGTPVASKYVDSTDVLKKELGKAFKPTSPAVVEAGGKSHLELAYGGIVEIPAEGAPKRLWLSPEEGVATGPSDGLGQGGRLAAAPDGTLWGATGSIRNENLPEPVGGVPVAGLMAFSGTEGSSEIGWTGGQVSVEPARTHDKCVLEPYVLGNNAYLQHIAAGSGGKVFALAPEYLLREEEVEIGEEEFEKVPLPGPFFPSIVELGPGGGGCPEAGATAPVAKNGEAEIKGEEPVTPGTELTLSTHVKQADALKVEWEFGDGSKPVVVVSTSRFQDPKIKHKFDPEGAFTVTAKIYSSDLAAAGQTVYKEGHLTTPTLKVERKLLISRPHPKSEFSIAPSVVNIGQTATFTGEASDANGKEALPLEYSWDFGDGTTAAGITTTSHAYATPGTYAVTLTVTDHLKLKGSVTHNIVVSAPPAPPPPPGNENSNGGGTSTTPPASPSAPPNQQVQSYQASLAGTSLSVASNGTLALTVKCLGKSSCSGSVTLRTLKAVSASASASARKQILLLGSSSFSISGGSAKKVTVHLNAKARRLLARVHVLSARAAIVARDSSGVLHTTQSTVTLRAAKRKHH